VAAADGPAGERIGRGGAAWEVRAAVRALRRSAPLGDEVCVGLSGGADSLALTAAAVAEFSAVTALVVDHGLQAGSDRVARDAAARARALGARARVLPVTVAPAGDGPEAAARRARLAALDAARDGRPVLLGHTLDDQAETVLLGLARGSGARSLRGMTAWSEPWGRPLLGVRAATTRAACGELGLDWWDDPHNTDPAYRRVRVRGELLPLLEDVLGPGAAPALARTAGLLRADDDALEALAARVPLPPRGEGLDVTELEPLPPAVLGRVLRRWLLDCGVPAPTGAHLEAVGALVTRWAGQGPVAVGGGPGDGGTPTRLVVARSRGKLVATTRGAGAQRGAHAAGTGTGTT